MNVDTFPWLRAGPAGPAGQTADNAPPPPRRAGRDGRPVCPFFPVSFFLPSCVLSFFSLFVQLSVRGSELSHRDCFSLPTYVFLLLLLLLFLFLFLLLLLFLSFQSFSPSTVTYRSTILSIRFLLVGGHDLTNIMLNVTSIQVMLLQLIISFIIVTIVIADFTFIYLILRTKI